VVNFFNAVAHDVRKHLAEIGVRSLQELIGRPEFLRQRHVPGHPKANTISLSKVLVDVARQSGRDLARVATQTRNDGIKDAPLDDRIIADVAQTIQDAQTPVSVRYDVVNTNRNIGTKLSGRIAKRHNGNHVIPDGTIDIQLRGSAGQSLGTFLCGGIRLTLTGEANDYVGKGMCGGEIIVKAPPIRAFKPQDNAIIGNTVMYGATGGRLFANGRAGERFCVRNSGGVAVVEGVGDHGCEYMTDGTVVILGPTGKNFGAGMSGGRAYILDGLEHMELMLNDEMVNIVPFDEPDDIESVRSLIQRHHELTGSDIAAEVLADWSASIHKIVKVAPKGNVAATARLQEQGKVRKPK
jgi:glutamate synthase domain-containing protein 3